MNKMYNEEKTHAILLVDGKNAFNSLTKQSFLHSVPYFCPSISTFVKNYYNAPPSPFILGGTENLSIVYVVDCSVVGGLKDLIILLNVTGTEF